MSVRFLNEYAKIKGAKGIGSVSDDGGVAYVGIN